MTVIEAPCCLCGSLRARRLRPAKLPKIIDPVQFSYAGNKNFHGQIVQCVECGHRFIYPVPDDLPGMYREVTDPYYVRTETQRRRTFDDFLDAKECLAKQRGTLLDIGCYTGLFLETAQQRGYRVEGLEPCRWAAAIARQKGFTVHETTIETLDPALSGFDNVTSFDVIEHLQDPLSAARTIHRLLAPHGCWTVVVPDMAAWHARLLGSRHWLVVLMHLHYFTRRTLKLLLAQAGFSRFVIVAAPPYRICLDNAMEYGKYNPVLRYPLALMRSLRLPNVEIRLHASLMGVAWK